MPTTITRGATVISPTMMLGYDASSDVPTIEHELLDGTVRYSLRPGRPRQGTLNLFFATSAAAWAAFTAHRVTGPLTLVDTDVPAAGMVYVAGPGAVQITLDPETRRRWIVKVPFREVV